MRWLRSSAIRTALLALAAAAWCVAQGTQPLANPRVRALGDQLLCMCGCGASVTSCNMLHCHFSDPAREKLLTMVNAGMSDSDIFGAFVKEYGTQILLKPPAEGFNIVGYLMPFAGILIGLGIVWLVIQRFRKPLAVAAGPEIDPATLARYQERIEKDLEKLD